MTSRQRRNPEESLAPGSASARPWVGSHLQAVLVQGLRLEYADIPATRAGGPPIVLLHEGLGCVTMWRDFPQRLAAATGCRTVAWSRAGYGGSDPPGAPRTRQYLHIEAQEAVPAMLAALDVERPVLVGHSDGASIALLYAATFPEAPSAVVAMAPHEFVESETLAGLRAAREAWGSSDWRQRLARHHRDVDRVFHDWNDTWLSSEFLDWNIEESLSAIRCPVLAIQGEDDAYATMRQIDVIAERAPGTILLKVPTCGHCPHLDQPDGVLAEVTALVDGLGGEPANK